MVWLAVLLLTVACVIAGAHRSPLSPVHFATVALLLLSCDLLVRLQLGLAAAQSRVWLAVLLHCSRNCRYSLPPSVAAQSVVWLTVLLLAAACFPVFAVVLSSPPSHPPNQRGRPDVGCC